MFFSYFRFWKQLVKQLVEPKQNFKAIGRRIKLFAHLFVVLKRKAVSHIGAQAHPAEYFELGRNARLIQQQQVLFISAPHRIISYRLKPRSACAGLYGHAQLPALGFIKYKINVIAQVHKLKILGEGIGFAQLIGYIKCVFKIGADPAYPAPNAYFALKSHAQPYSRHADELVVDKAVAGFKAGINAVFMPEHIVQRV